MPLIDESNNLLDAELMNRVAEKFSTKNGLIIDNFGNQWYMWRTDGLESWWRFFEETIDAPMGRRLANSSCDEEEYLLNSLELDFTGLFKKKKSQNALQKRWEIHGWGFPQLAPPSFDSSGLTPLFAGILQADIERINSKRTVCCGKRKITKRQFSTWRKVIFQSLQQSPRTQLRNREKVYC